MAPRDECPSCAARRLHTHLVVGATPGGNHRVTVRLYRPTGVDDWMVEWHYRYPTSDDSLARLLNAAGPHDLITTPTVSETP